MGRFVNTDNSAFQVAASILSPYMGFTEKEVKELCKKYHIDSWRSIYICTQVDNQKLL